ncbi:MAG TPA: hypothetical protein VJU58_13720 [Microbacterium sp.]|nr:hypothetical protein [Microbacterium sp.]
MGNALLTVSGGHRRAYPLDLVRVVTHLGAGRLVYVSDDRWIGVQLDGESRVDEYQPSSVSVEVAA